MSLVDRDSLASTLDSVNDAFFHGRPLPARERADVAWWIAGRRGGPGAYAGMFAPTASDFECGVRLFTGERVRSRAGIGHVLGEEACRALILLGEPSADVRGALGRAGRGMLDRLNAKGDESGMYCCGTCTPALWRHLAVGGLEDAEARLTRGISTLKSFRDGNGRWGRFPFHYTLLALSEIELPSAVDEMRYASPVCERYLRRAPAAARVSQRRRFLAEKVLARC